MTKAAKKSIAKGAFIVRNTKGLHTRPCTEIVKCSSKFKSEIILSYHGLEASATSLLEILMFAAGKGAKISITAKGVDASDAVNAILALAENQFNIEY